MAWELSTARCQVAIFYNTQIQWLDSSAIIKKVLCAFNNPGKERIKQILQERQHQRWVGGADSTNGWLTQRWDDTVTAILFAEGTWHHQRWTRDYCWIQGQCAERRQHTHLFWGISHVSPTHTPDKERGENRNSAVFYNIMHTAYRFNGLGSLKAMKCKTILLCWLISIQTSKQWSFALKLINAESVSELWNSQCNTQNSM